MDRQVGKCPGGSPPQSAPPPTSRLVRREGWPTPRTRRASRVLCTVDATEDCFPLGTVQTATDATARMRIPVRAGLDLRRVVFASRAVHCATPPDRRRDGR